MKPRVLTLGHGVGRLILEGPAKPRRSGDGSVADIACAEWSTAWRSGTAVRGGGGGWRGQRYRTRPGGSVPIVAGHVRCRWSAEALEANRAAEVRTCSVRQVRTQTYGIRPCRCRCRVWPGRREFGGRRAAAYDAFGFCPGRAVGLARQAQSAAAPAIGAPARYWRKP